MALIRLHTLRRLVLGISAGAAGGWVLGLLQKPAGAGPLGAPAPASLGSAPPGSGGDKPEGGPPGGRADADMASIADSGVAPGTASPAVQDPAPTVSSADSALPDAEQQAALDEATQRARQPDTPASTVQAVAPVPTPPARAARTRTRTRTGTEKEPDAETSGTAAPGDGSDARVPPSPAVEPGSTTGA